MRLYDFTELCVKFHWILSMNIEVVNFNKMSEENQESLNIIELNIEDNHDIAKKKV